MIKIENMIDERQQKLRQIADHYQEKQLWKLAEERGELVQALSKYALTGDKRPVIEEIADVKNVAPQVEYLLGIEDDVEPMMEYKLDRTIKDVGKQQKKNGLPGADAANVFKQKIGRTDMQELEKILEEIEILSLGKYYIETEKIKEIIHKHMNDGWIPVERELPKEGQEVWISTDAGCVRRGMYTKRYGYGMREGFVCSDGFMYMNTASAWQPYFFPKPYRPERRKDGQAD